ncbi:MAG: beta-ketoacyl synthase N-terminal-like domain-containing protein, partial [Raoultibacter sp.]
FGNLGALTKATDPQAASTPFDVRRSGFVAGEGAGAVVLESLEHALGRGAHILAEIVGFGSTGDGYHMTAPTPDGSGLIRAMGLALTEGGFTPNDIGHVNAHGTSTPANDKAESAALIGLAGEGTTIPVVSVKGVTGHMLGGAGAVEAIVTALSVAEGVVPATTGFAEPDPECPVRVLTEPLRDYPQRVALSNSLGFGGHNATLAIAPYHNAR